MLITWSVTVGFVVVGLVVLLAEGGAVSRPPAGEPVAALVPAGTGDLQVDIAVMGVEAFLAGCRPVASAPDPGHPGGLSLTLWQPPARYGVRVLECFNGTPTRDGVYERCLLGVSAEHHDPIAAAAASYGVDAATYIQLATRA